MKKEYYFNSLGRLALKSETLAKAHWLYKENDEQFVA